MHNTLLNLHSTWVDINLLLLVTVLRKSCLQWTLMKPNSKRQTTPRKNRIALVLQGGGAMGAYQAGVYQALDEQGLCPDWVVGTSIGAINAALIAGNPLATHRSGPACRFSNMLRRE